MKLFPVHPVLWSCLLALSETQTNDPDICQDEMDPGSIFPQSPSAQRHNVEEAKVNENFRCLFYPTDLLNCSWSFQSLHKDAQLFVNMSVCDDNRAVHSLNLSSEHRVGSLSVTLHDHEAFYVILRFNISLYDQWTVYTSAYDMDFLEVLSPPPNISASVKEDGGLLVTWSLPHSRIDPDPSCFEYQLDMGDQERPKNLSDQLSYTELNADPVHTYSVRMRTRKRDECQEASQWSDWSHTITVDQSIFKFISVIVLIKIISISLGIPMILLAVLLLFRHQRLTELLFPPIPRPPPKYKCFLEKNDTFNPFLSAPTAEPEEELTKVEDVEETPGKTL